ncbi:acyl carrier protein [Pseudomonas mangiferae]|uniref:Acyl carrier protein n=1 Tax=Pseudomonas mangiferae TaxID=2593654 RepID=A0A553H0A1_9PSED|nr:acyl carrier protein [Pseudomonas mangiferae]TRX75185.1 acyl carrier protein [Pseudomonas mangiferae]
MNRVERERIVAFLRERILQRTGLPEARLDNDTPLTDLGIKSVDVVLISGEIEDHFDLEVDPVMMFEYRTVDAVADRLLVLLERA